MGRNLTAVVLALAASATSAEAGDGAKALVEEFGITTYTASRKDDNIYELQEGYVVRTNYCYAYVYYEDVVVTKSKIIFVESDEVCDIADVYRR